MLKEEISAYEDLCDFFYEVSPLMYCTPMNIDIYAEFIRYVALMTSSLDATAKPFRITFNTKHPGTPEPGVDIRIYGMRSGDGKYYSTQYLEGTDNLLMFISKHVPKGLRANKNSIVVETCRYAKKWHGLKFFIDDLDTNAIFHGLALVYEYYGRKNALRYIPADLDDLQDAATYYEKIELVRDEDRVFGMVYQPNLHRVEITQFVSNIRHFVRQNFPLAMEQVEFSLKFPYTYGVGKHWYILKCNREMIEVYATGPYVSRYAQHARISTPVIELLTRRMVDMCGVYLDINPETLTMVV